MYQGLNEQRSGNSGGGGYRQRENGFAPNSYDSRANWGFRGTRPEREQPPFRDSPREISREKDFRFRGKRDWPAVNRDPRGMNENFHQRDDANPHSPKRRRVGRERDDAEPGDLSELKNGTRFMSPGVSSPPFRSPPPRESPVHRSSPPPPGARSMSSFASSPRSHSLSDTRSPPFVSPRPHSPRSPGKEWSRLDYDDRDRERDKFPVSHYRPARDDYRGDARHTQFRNYSGRDYRDQPFIAQAVPTSSGKHRDHNPHLSGMRSHPQRDYYDSEYGRPSLEGRETYERDSFDLDALPYDRERGKDNNRENNGGWDRDRDKEFGNDYSREKAQDKESDRLTTRRSSLKDKSFYSQEDYFFLGDRSKPPDRDKDDIVSKDKYRELEQPRDPPKEKYDVDRRGESWQSQASFSTEIVPSELPRKHSDFTGMPSHTSDSNSNPAIRKTHADAEFISYAELPSPVDDLNSRSRSYPKPTFERDASSSTPPSTRAEQQQSAQPKRSRLGWGQGLVALEKKTTRPEDEIMVEKSDKPGLDLQSPCPPIGSSIAIEQSLVLTAFNVSEERSPPTASPVSPPPVDSPTSSFVRVAPVPVPPPLPLSPLVPLSGYRGPDSPASFFNTSRESLPSNAARTERPFDPRIISTHNRTVAATSVASDYASSPSDPRIKDLSRSASYISTPVLSPGPFNGLSNSSFDIGYYSSAEIPHTPTFVPQSPGTMHFTPTSPSLVSCKPEVEEPPTQAPPEPEPEPEPEPLCPFPSLPTKEELLLSMEKADMDIAKTEADISNLRKQKLKLEQSPKKHKHHLKHHMTLVQQIYEENHEKVSQANEDLNTLYPESARPSPIASSSEVEKVLEPAVLRQLVSAVLKRRNQAIAQKQQQLVSQYRKLHESWKKKCVAFEEHRENKLQKSGRKSIDLDSLSPRGPGRPALRSSNPGRAPNTPTGNGGSRRSILGSSDAVRSEVEFVQIMNQLKEMEANDPNSRFLSSLAEIPAMIMDERERNFKFIDTTNYVEDSMALERERKLTSVWSEDEKSIFLKKFLLYPKRFKKIASFLENKKTEDCVMFYYNNKKTLNLKKLLRQQQVKKRGVGKRTTLEPSMPRELANLGYWNPGERRSQRSAQENEDDEYAEPVSLTLPKQEKRSASRPSLLQSGTEVRWTDSERVLFIEALSKYGKDFKALAEYVSTKTQLQCRTYYHTHKLKYNWDQLALHANPGAAIDDDEDAKLEEDKSKEREKKEKEKGKARKANQDSPDLKKKVLAVSVSAVPRDSESESAEEDEELELTESDRNTLSTWTSGEKQDFIKYLAIYGKNWTALSFHIATKTEHLIKVYFLANKVKLNLGDLLESTRESREARGVREAQKRKAFDNKDKGRSRKKRADSQVPQPSTPTTPRTKSTKKRPPKPLQQSTPTSTLPHISPAQSISAADRPNPLSAILNSPRSSGTPSAASDIPWFDPSSKTEYPRNCMCLEFCADSYLTPLRYLLPPVGKHSIASVATTSSKQAWKGPPGGADFSLENLIAEQLLAMGDGALSCGTVKSAEAADAKPVPQPPEPSESTSSAPQTQTDPNPVQLENADFAPDPPDPPDPPDFLQQTHTPQPVSLQQEHLNLPVDIQLPSPTLPSACDSPQLAQLDAPAQVAPDLPEQAHLNSPSPDHSSPSQVEADNPVTTSQQPPADTDTLGEISDSREALPLDNAEAEPLDRLGLQQAASPAEEFTLHEPPTIPELHPDGTAPDLEILGAVMEDEPVATEDQHLVNAQTGLQDNDVVMVQQHETTTEHGEELHFHTPFSSADGTNIS